MKTYKIKEIERRKREKGGDGSFHIVPLMYWKKVSILKALKCGVYFMFLESLCNRKKMDKH